MSRKNDETYVVVKANIPSSLKLQFKILSTQRKLTMSKVLEELIKNWIQANASISGFTEDFSHENLEEIKGYIPQSLKTQFKVCCTQKMVTMSFVLCNLINEWVKARDSNS